MRNDFCVFICSNGRAGSVTTIKALEGSGYTGDWYILCDDLDRQLDDYRREYGAERVQVFDKKAMAAIIDTGTNDGDMRAIVYARNACFDVAKSLGYRYFMELDDDIKRFMYKKDKHDGRLRERLLPNLDAVIESMIGFMESTKTTTIAMAQGGDFIGGINGGFFKKGLARKAMNSFICDVERRFWFCGKQNEDVSTYVTLSNRGKLFFTFTKCGITPEPTQKLAGGMTEVYKESGGYTKPFSSVIFAPFAVKVRAMSSKHARIHHAVSWNNCAPCIINERWKKA